MKFIIVTGARPNFMKIMPLCEEFDKEGIEYDIFNSGQHYDKELNDIFQKQFNIKNIYNFKVNHNNKIEDIQKTIYNFKKFIQQRDDFAGVIVVGDVDTTFACALTTRRYSFPLIHIEAGLRSFDHTMPEERNRISVDHLSYILFASCNEAVHNLYEEGIEEDVYMVGNIMIDTLIKFFPEIREKVSKRKKPYIVTTFHRPENVDTKKIYTMVTQLESVVANGYDVIFPVHPRTYKRLEECKLLDRLKGCSLVKPMGYIDFMAEVLNADCVITDSGGIQEETTYLNIPCFTVRKSTERPITITEGTNELINMDDIVNKLINTKKKIDKRPIFWDGGTAKRIIDILKGGIL